MMKVFAFFGSHTIYESLWKFPPKNVYFLPRFAGSTYDRLLVYLPWKLKVKERIIKPFLRKTGIPRMIYIFRTFDCDLIHSSRGFLVLNRKPWVVDIEYAPSFGNFENKKTRRFVLKLLSSPYCKRVIPHSYAALYSFLNGFKVKDEGIKRKLEVLYSAIQVRKTKKRKHERFRIGFLATRDKFYRKGGRELLRAFSILRKKYDVELWIKSKIPSMTRKTFDFKFVHVIEKHFSRDELFEKFYNSIDIFVLPTYGDSFGFALLEAMSVGLPVIASKMFAIPEIIEDGQNEFLINTPLKSLGNNYLPTGLSDVEILKGRLNKVVNELVEKISILIENSSLRKKMGRCGKKLVENGKFSIKERNKKLKRIYEEALE